MSIKEHWSTRNTLRERNLLSNGAVDPIKWRSQVQSRTNLDREENSGGFGVLGENPLKCDVFREFLET